NPKKDSLTNEVKITIAQQGPGQEVAFRENLKAVADPDDLPAVVRELHHLFHDRRETSNGPAAEIIAVRKTAGKNDAVKLGKLGFFVPNVDGLLPHHIVYDAEAVSIAIGTWEDNDAEFHILQSPLSFVREGGVSIL